MIRRGELDSMRAVRPSSSALLAEQMQGHLATVRSQPVLPDVDALPGAESQVAADERDRELDRRQGGAHVRRHVVRTFVAMTKERIAVDDKAREEAVEVAHHLR